MRIINLLVLVFLLSAFAIGVTLEDSDNEIVDVAFNNATKMITNITLGESNDSYANGVLIITENYIKFIGVTILEVTKLGVFFGKENPQYFEPEFIIKIVKLLVWFAIISLLIQPLFYLVVFIIMGCIWIKDMIVKRRSKKQ